MCFYLFVDIAPAVDTRSLVKKTAPDPVPFPALSPGAESGSDNAVNYFWWIFLKYLSDIMLLFAVQDIDKVKEQLSNYDSTPRKGSTQILEHNINIKNELCWCCFWTVFFTLFMSRGYYCSSSRHTGTSIKYQTITTVLCHRN